MELTLPDRIADGLRVEALLDGEHVPYRSISGGRGSGKSKSFAQLAVVRSYQFDGGYIYAARAIQDSLKDSSKPAIEWAIDVLGVHSDFKVLENEIRNQRSGVTFRFTGLEKKRSSLRGWEQVRLVWIGEAHDVSHETARILIPTVHRFPNVEIWLDWNPHSATDWVHGRFVDNPQPTDIHFHTTWKDNPFFPPGLERERQMALQGDREEYEWVWEGALLPRSGGFRILPKNLLELCRSVKPETDFSSMPVHAGFDPGGGSDPNGIAFRRGPEILLIDHEQGVGPRVQARLRDELQSNRASRLYYDAGVVVTQPPTGEWETEPVLFGSSVKGPDNFYTKEIRNKDKFAYRNSQLGFNLKHRAEATRDRFERGDKSIPEEKCLFLPSNASDELIMELSQPIWTEDARSRVRIEKAARDGEESPNRYDALVLSFAEDTEYGLEHYRFEPEPIRVRTDIVDF